MIGGFKSSHGYVTKFTYGSLEAHPDFTASSSWTMDALSAGTEDITTDSGQNIGIVTMQSVSAISYSNQTVIYVTSSSYASDVNYQTNDQSYSILENTSTQISSDLPWSVSGLTSISFNVTVYLSTVPSWISINSTSGVLNISTPNVTSDLEYYFYISSFVNGISEPVKKLIKLTIQDWISSNWEKWLNTSSSIWETCKSGYYLNSGVWNLQKYGSETAKALSKSTASI